MTHKRMMFNYIKFHILKTKQKERTVFAMIPHEKHLLQENKRDETKNTQDIKPGSK